MVQRLLSPLLPLIRHIRIMLRSTLVSILSMPPVTSFQIQGDARFIPRRNTHRIFMSTLRLMNLLAWLVAAEFVEHGLGVLFCGVGDVGVVHCAALVSMIL